MSSLKLASTLKEATRFLDVSPLRFPDGDIEDPAPSTDGHRYVKRPGVLRPGKKPLRVMEKVRSRLLEGRPDAKLFLTGHVGCGKSTELAQLCADKEIRGRFLPIIANFEEEEWAYIDFSQVLFRLAAELFEYGQKHKLLKSEGLWKKQFKRVNDLIIGPTGVGVDGGAMGLEINLVIVKLRQELKLSDRRRKLFRDYAETNQTVLQDLIKVLVEEIDSGLADKGDGRELLLVVDDLDKVRNREQLDDLFDRNLNALLQPPIRMLSTLPTSVAFSSMMNRLRDHIEYLRPIQVLEKKTYEDPMEAFDRGSVSFFREVVANRVEPDIIAPDALELALLYSGGVLRDFFHMLREAVFRAVQDELDQVTLEAMEEAIGDIRRKWSYGIYPPDKEALRTILERFELQNEEQTVFLDRSWVLECENASVWYAVNPLLRKLL